MIDDDDSANEVFKDENFSLTVNDKEEVVVKDDKEVSFLCPLSKHDLNSMSNCLNECDELLNEELKDEKEQLCPKELILVKSAQEGTDLGINFVKDESFKLFSSGLLDLFDMLCSHRVLLYNGNLNHYHPAWSIGEYVRGEIHSNVQVNV